MSETKALEDFRRDADAWFAENTPKDVGFMLPLTFMEVGTQQQFDFLRDWQRRVWEAGFLGAAWPTDYGGGGLPQAYQDVATEAGKRAGAPIMLNAIGLNWTGPLILDIGTEAQKAAYIRDILSAEAIWCQGFSEPEHGSDLGSAQTRAVRDGDDYVITGSKIWTTQGNFADYMILLARTDGAPDSRHRGLSFFLSPMKIDGISTTPIRKLTGEYGFTQTFFEGARIPADCRMGAEGEGWKIAVRLLEYERGARGGQAGGHVITDQTPDQMIAMLRRLAGGNGAIADPLMRDELVDILMDYRAIQLNRARSAIAPLVAEAPHSLPLIEKLVWTEFMRSMNQSATSMQGAHGAYYVGDEAAVEDGLWQRAYLNAFSATIGGGTSQIQKNIIGEHVLGLAKDGGGR